MCLQPKICYICLWYIMVVVDDGEIVRTWEKQSWGEIQQASRYSDTSWFLFWHLISNAVYSLPPSISIHCTHNLFSIFMASSIFSLHCVNVFLPALSWPHLRNILAPVSAYTINIFNTLLALWPLRPGLHDLYWNIRDTWPSILTLCCPLWGFDLDLILVQILLYYQSTKESGAKVTRGMPEDSCRLCE